MQRELSHLVEGLTAKIQAAYETAVTMDEAEKLASEFLHAQLLVAEEVRSTDLDARMRKSGLKAIKSAVRTAEVKAHEKKPTEGALEDVVNLDGDVQKEQNSFDKAEVDRDYLLNILDVFKNAHLHFRGISKGRYE